MRYFSQMKQDEVLDKYIFKGKENGYFVDVGAYDGETFSNSLFFEKYRNWRGICFEPIPSVYSKLKLNRPETICINACVGNTVRSNVPFNWVNGPSEMLSGINTEYHRDHEVRISCENRSNGGKNRILSLPMTTLASVFEEEKIDHVDYLSIDTEGAELLVLKGINFKNVKIDVIDVEENYPSESLTIGNYLESVGYTRFHRIGVDSLYLHEDFRKRNPSLRIPPEPNLIMDNTHITRKYMGKPRMIGRRYKRVRRRRRRI